MAFVAILLLSWTPAVVGADSSVSASPAVVMLRGTPGQTTTQTLTITNATAERLAFEMVAKDVVVRGGRRLFVNAGELPGSIAATANFSQRQVTVDPGQSVRVDMTVTVPPNPAGRAIVGLFHGTTKMQRKATTLTASVGTLLTFSLSDQVAMDLSPLTVKPPSTTANLSISQRLTNSGSEPVVAKGILAIISGSGSLIGKQAIPPRRLLPGEQTDIKADYPGDLPRGRYRALVTYDLEKKTATSSADFEVR
jgi:hypothetical protein